MKNKRLLIALTGAVLFGLVAAYSITLIVSNAHGYTKSLKDVVVAKVEIPVGSTIIREQLVTVQFPNAAIPDGSFDSVDKVAGRIAVRTVAPKEPITKAVLAPEGSSGGLSAVIPEGYRAMTVKVDDVVGISGFIQPGTLVDVVVVIDPPKDSGQKDTVSKIVLQNIKVLANGQNIDKPKDEREAKAVRAVTLQVTPEEAEKLALAATEGRLQLVMRNSVDQEDAQTPGANKTTLLAGEDAKRIPEPGISQTRSEQPMPARARSLKPKVSRASPSVQQIAAPRASVEVFEGSKRKTVEFP